MRLLQYRQRAALRILNRHYGQYGYTVRFGYARSLVAEHQDRPGWPVSADTPDELHDRISADAEGRAWHRERLLGRLEAALAVVEAEREGREYMPGRETVS